MEQLQEQVNYLRSQAEEQQSTIAHQQNTLASLSDRITRIDHSLAYTAGTTDAAEDPLVRERFFHEHVSRLTVAADLDENRWGSASREMNRLIHEVNSAISALHLRVDEERGTGLRTMQNLEGALAKLRTLEESASTFRSSGNPSQWGTPGDW